VSTSKSRRFWVPMKRQGSAGIRVLPIGCTVHRRSWAKKSGGGDKHPICQLANSHAVAAVLAA